MELLVSELYILAAVVCGGITTIIFARNRFGNTEINTKLKSIINSQNLSIKVLDDLKSK